jgi:hypothetical protein
MSSAVLSDTLIQHPFTRFSSETNRSITRVVGSPTEVPKNWYRFAKDELDMLALLPAAWDGLSAPKPDRAIIDSVRGFIDYLEKNADRFRLEEPTLAPTMNGGILIEWNETRYRLDIEFAAPRVAQFACFDRRTQKQSKGVILAGSSVPDQFSKCLEYFCV